MTPMIQRATVLALSATLVACAAQLQDSSDGGAEALPTAPSEPEHAPPPPPPVAPTPPRIREQQAQMEMAADHAMPAVAAQRSYTLSTQKMLPGCCQPQVLNREQYQSLQNNGVHVVTQQPVSTFSIDVDTGAYANVRRFLNAGQLPPSDAVRVEEMINYFDYAYPAPRDRSQPFTVNTDMMTAPWNDQALLMRIGIQGFSIQASERPPANLVFLVDVSGSMHSPDKLPLLKSALQLLTAQLGAQDRVAIVTYAGNSGVVLESTGGDRKYRIRQALEQLQAGGSTNGGSGIKLAYELAREGYIKDGINRVVLATDGDFNVGVVDFKSLLDIVERQRASGIALTALGFGTGNYNEKLVEQLADAGNGNYAYIDTLSEARKVLVSQLNSTLFTIARDVKIQVEFNPALVQEYRLIGYENRMLAREDFNNDRVDAGEVGAGHSVTALYEVIPVGARGHTDPLRYGGAAQPARGDAEMAFVRVRYKQPDEERSRLLEQPVRMLQLTKVADAQPDFRFAASVAAFGQLLRDPRYLGEFGFDDVVELARGALRDDHEGYRREFVSLVSLADSLNVATAAVPEQRPASPPVAADGVDGRRVKGVAQ